MNEVLKAIKTRRSVRKFKEEQIDKDLLNEILTAGLYAPSAKNTQNWQLTVVQDVDKLTKLQKVIAKELNNPNYNRFYNAPTLIIVTTPKNYELGDLDASCVLENIFLAAHSLGIGSVWINQLLNLSDNIEVRNILTSFNIPKDHRVWGCAALGLADGEVKTDRNNKGKVVFA